MFADQCVKHLAIIRSADMRTGSDAAHTLKGAALAIGAWSVAEAAEKVEEALGAQSVADQISDLAKAADAARAAIAAMRFAA